MPRDKQDEELVALAMSHQNVSRFLEEKKVVKTIVVPNKLLNFVVE